MCAPQKSYQPLYDVTRSIEENLSEGPFVDPTLSQTDLPCVPREQWRRLLGYPIASPIGVSACPLTAHARGVQVACSLGYHILTFKTIRSRAHRPHPFPQVTHLSRTGLKDEKKSFRWYAALHQERGGRPWLGVSNSIGIGSPDLEVSLREIAVSRAALPEGTLLVVSIFGTGQTSFELIADFVLLAQSVQAAGAQVVEINCSCPNLGGQLLYEDYELLASVLQAVVRAVGIPVIVKIGVSKGLPQIVSCIARAGAQGVSGINCVPGRVVTKSGVPFFGADRSVSGISGDPIRARAFSWLDEVVNCNRKNRYGLNIFFMGGLTQPEHFYMALQRGADAVLSATGALWYPDLAYRYHAQYTDISIHPTEQERANGNKV